MRRMLSMLMAILFVVSIPLTALAVEVDVSLGNVTINDTNVQHTTSEGFKDEAHGGSVTVIQSNSETATSNTVSVTTTTNDVTVTLDNVNISSGYTPSVNIDAGTGTTVTIELDGSNDVINVAKSSDDGTLVIQDADSDGGSLTATGTQSHKNAAIGSLMNHDVSNITINSGTITAGNGGGYGAAIGSGKGGDASNITINGGTVTADSNYGAAIGSGQGGDASNITINGGTINVEGEYGAGIGGGQYGDVSNITITDDATVIAEGGRGAAIGGGQEGNGTDITITGNADVTASVITGPNEYSSNGKMGAAIGGGQKGNGTEIKISGNATVTASAENGAAIGGGGNGNSAGTGSNITISERAQVTTSSDGNDFGGGKGQAAVEPNTDGLYNTGSVNGVKGTVEDPNPPAPPAPPAPEPEYTPVYTPAPAEPELPEAPAQVEVKIDTEKEIVVDLAAGTQDGKPMEKIEVEVETVEAEENDTAEAVVIPANTTIVIHKVEIAAEETVEEVAKEEVAMVFAVSCIQENVVTSLPGVVKLSIPAPEFEMDGFVLVFVNANGEQIEIPYKLADGKLVFETEFVGLYMIVKK